MIRVTKPEHAPAVLKTKGKTKSRAHSVASTRSAKAYHNGLKKFDFDANIYAHKTVKDALIKAQHDKCFLCESKITHISYGDVEHFRPKAGYRQSVGDALRKPGYYWLAYEWNNLFLACQLCNQLFKKNLFPLLDPTTRANSHKDNIENEKPAFIDPTIDDPEEFISFRREIPYPINDNPRGRATIRELGLTRPKLNEKRFEHYKLLQSLYRIAHLKPSIPESANAKNLLAAAVQDFAEYAGMTRAAIHAKFSVL